MRGREWHWFSWAGHGDKGSPGRGKTGALSSWEEQEDGENLCLRR